MRELWVDYVVTHPHLFNSGAEGQCSKCPSG
jgi:hypothetical protein